MSRISVHVTPRSTQNRVVRSADGAIQIWVSAAPADNAANLAVVKVLADALGIPKTTVTIVRGQSSRTKLLEVPLTEAEIASRLTEAT